MAFAFCLARYTVLAADDSKSSSAAPARAASSTDAPLQFRRIFVPAEKLEAWPRDGEKYLPIEASDFDKWVRSANEAAASGKVGATVDDAEYTARLENDSLLQGEGKWTIQLRGDKPAFLPLDNLSLVLSNVHWRDSPQ